MNLSFRPETTIFLILLGITSVVWVLRGLTVLSSMPGGVLWVLLFLTISAGVIRLLGGLRRF